MIENDSLKFAGFKWTRFCDVSYLKFLGFTVYVRIGDSVKLFGVNL